MLLIITINAALGQYKHLDFSKVKEFEHQLNDVMEVTDTVQLKIKLMEVEEAFKQNPNGINKLRLGIIYHEVALNLSFFSTSEFNGYAKKSFDLLSELMVTPNIPKEQFPFIVSYRASAMSLVSAETRALNLLGDAFEMFDEAIINYADVSYLPEFLRGSVAENLPWFFFSKRKYAKQDFQSIIDKQRSNNLYANWKIMSFTYWAWAKQRPSKKYRAQAIIYLEKSIALDPNYEAGRAKSEALLELWTK